MSVVLPAPRTGHGVEKSLHDALLRGLHDVLAEGCAGGNWGDVRGSADGLIALNECLGVAAYPQLRKAAEAWLRGKTIAHADGASWEEEVWDTAIATLAVCTHDPENERARGSAIRWLKAAHERGHSNWNDEPWETMWALLALNEARQANHHEALAGLSLDETFAWLTGLIGPGGQLVNFHYTALFVLVANRFADVRGPVAGELIAKREDALAALLGPMARWTGGSAGELWTRELWANSLVLWALSESGAFTAATPGAAAVAGWFGRQLAPAPDGAVPDVLTEDRAFACVALFHAIVSLRCAERGGAYREDVEKEIRAELADVLKPGRPDYAPAQKLLEVVDGYYRVHLRRRIVDPVLIGVACVLLGWGAGESRSIEAWLGARGAAMLRGTVILAGAFAVVLGAMGMTLKDLFGRKPPKG